MLGRYTPPDSVNNVLIRSATAADIPAWLALRLTLWPEHRADELSLECEALLASPDQICFAAFDAQQQMRGFVEAGVYREQSEPYCHIEGWYVSEGTRGQGVGKALMCRVQEWALHRAIAYLTSDTSARYPISPRAHAAAGFEQSQQITVFVKKLSVERP